MDHDADVLTDNKLFADLTRKYEHVIFLHDMATVPIR
jgi:hypothetical protein